jgi:glycopeptide antibiotics resistance protein
VLYLFDENGGTRALDHAGSGHHLEIPSRIQIFERNILALPWKEFRFKRSFFLDIIINLVGFIPFGFVLIALLIRLGGIFEKHDVFITVALCFMVSLSIEILQSWIPSRSSHMLDLLLNTLGGLTGAIIYRFFYRWAYGKVKG